MAYLKLKVINYLLKYNLKIGRKLSFYKAKYSAGEEVEQMVKKQKFDLRGMRKRVKKVILHDQDIIDKRREICDGCEFKLGLNCKKCGCFIAAKTRVATTSCPVNKWGAEYNFKEDKSVNGSRTTTEL